MSENLVQSIVAHQPVPSSRETLFSCPFSGQPLGRFAPADLGVVIRALQAGSKAAGPAMEEGVDVRLSRLQKLADLLRSSSAEMQGLEAQATGFPLSAIRDRDWKGLERFLDEAISALEGAPGALDLSPTGLTVALAPSTGTLFFVGSALVSALASGCPLVIKFSSKAPLTLKVWEGVVRDLDLPEGRISLLIGHGGEIGSALCAHPAVRAVVFAGRPETATLVRSAACKDVRHVQIHGGVKNSALILGDATTEQLRHLGPSLLLGAGRSPWSLSRVFVVEDRLDEVGELLRAFISESEPLRGVDGASVWTPALQSQDVEKAEEACRRASAENGRWIVPPEKREALFFRPGLMRDLTNCSSLQQEEITGGPILLTGVKYAHEMAKWTNVPDFGFVASVFGSEDRAMKLAAKTHVGRVWVNDWWPRSEPVFGWRKSFFGVADARWNGAFWSRQRRVGPLAADPLSAF